MGEEAMVADQQLLRQYAADGSEAAFGELVARYVNLVYSAALRRAGGDSHLAQDVAQLVFTDLARKARSLPPGVVLAGWLHRATSYATAQWLRTERRRHAREQEAVAMNALTSEPAQDWEGIRPLLDEALDRLGTIDRDALLLRFFEQRSLAEVGQALGANEEAARKRVSRALDKLRVQLLRRGITTPAAALASTIAAHAVQTAPAGLAGTLAAASLAGAVTTSALAAATASAASSSIWFGIMTTTRLKMTVLGALVGAVVSLSLWQPWRYGPPEQETEAPAQELESVPQPGDERQSLADAPRAVDEPARLLPAVRVAAAPAPEAEITNSLPEIEPWRQRFEAVYRLRDGEVLRHVAPPFIPERDEYYRQELRGQASIVTNAPDYFFIRQDEQGLRTGGYGFTDKLDLQHVLRHVLDLRRYELAGAEEVLALPVPGDWVVRDGTSLKAQLAALAPLLREATGRNLTFQRESIEDDVLVVRGNFAPEPGRNIDVFAEKTSTGAGGGSGDFPKFLEMLGDHLNIAFASEVQLLNLSPLSWRWHYDSSYSRAGDRRAELVGKTLENLRQQTGLSFELQRRPTQVWVVRETY